MKGRGGGGGVVVMVGKKNCPDPFYFDESALRTVKKANPLPPMPEAFRENGLEVGIRFRSAEFR